MSYLKLVNCPVRGVFPEKAKRAIDWARAGFIAGDIARFSVQGFDTAEQENYVSLFPIADKDKLTDSGIVDKVNTNANQNDTAEVITDGAADALKEVIIAAKPQA